MPRGRSAIGERRAGDSLWEMRESFRRALPWGENTSYKPNRGTGVCVAERNEGKREGGAGRGNPVTIERRNGSPSDRERRVLPIQEAPRQGACFPVGGKRGSREGR